MISADAVVTGSAIASSDPHLDDLEAARDRTFRRQPRLRVRDARTALRFLNEVGLASLFVTKGLPLPCLWVAVCGRRDPRFPHHSHHDPEVGMAWNLKDELPAAQRVFYSKLIRGRPTFVSLDLLPDLLALRRPRRDYKREYRAGVLTAAAKEILDALHGRGPRETMELKLETNLVRPEHRRTFDAVMTELQQSMYVTMSEVRYDPSFTYVWDLVESRFPDAVRESRRIRPAAAASRVAQRYIDAVIYAKPMHVAAVVGPAQAREALERLARAGAVHVDRPIRGLPGKWLIAADAARASS